MTLEEASALLCELIRKLNQMGSGDTLMNVMLGGVDEVGLDVSGELGVLMMECRAELGAFKAACECALPQGHARLLPRSSGKADGTLPGDENLICGRGDHSPAGGKGRAAAQRPLLCQ